MKQTFRTKKFSPDSLTRIGQCNAVLAQYRQKVTLRQLYYRLVAAALIENTPRSYKNIGSLVSDARLAGLIDWEAIEDRGRQPKAASEFDSLSDLVEAAVRAYRLPRWEGQSTYVEVWVEKDALSGVLEPVTRKHHVTLMVNKGYSSQSAMYEAAQRFAEKDDGERELVLLYFGDHDPSGEDMVRDVRERLRMFEVEVNVKKVALTMDQIEEYDPPPNPAKITDSRAAKYIEEFGDSSWELDALPPDVLTQLVDDEIAAIVDTDLRDEIIAREEKGKAALRKVAEKIK
jgi:hypothetical protein